MYGKKCVAEEEHQRYDPGPLSYCPRECKSGRSDRACLILNRDSRHENPNYIGSGKSRAEDFALACFDHRR